MDVKRINDFVRNLDSAIDITGITVYGVDDEGHSVKIDTEMLTNPKPTFTEASTRTNIVGSGESTTTLWGKVKKFFTDLKTVAFSGNYNDLNNTPEIKTVAITGVFSDLIDKNVSTGTVTFTEASSRTNIATGESQSTMWGKVKKYFTDLKAVAFSGSYSDLTDKIQNATTSAAGLMSANDKTKLDKYIYTRVSLTPAAGGESMESGFKRFVTQLTTLYPNLGSNTIFRVQLNFYNEMLVDGGASGLPSANTDGHFTYCNFYALRLVGSVQKLYIFGWQESSWYYREL